MRFKTVMVTIVALFWMVGTAGAEEIDITAKRAVSSVAAFSTRSEFRTGYITGFLRGVLLRDSGMPKTCSMSGLILEAYLDTGIQSGAIKPTDDFDLALFRLSVDHGC